MKEKIVIIGAGFAGLHLAKQLQHTQNEIVLIDKYNYHQFQPLFYQVATARIEPSSISFPLRKIFQKNKNISIRIAQVQRINTLNNEVFTSIGVFAYTKLIIATGCTTNFFGNQQIEAHAYEIYC
jgi:NADH dehydrogenase